MRLETTPYTINSLMFKNFLLKKMLDSQLKQVPSEQREMILKVVSENPDLFKKIAEEVQVKIKEGKDQQSAAMEVMMSHQAELQKALKPKL